MDFKEKMVNTHWQGLKGSGIGVWWIKKIDGKYLVHQTESSCDLYGTKLSESQPAELFGEKWTSRLKTVISINPSFEALIEVMQKSLNKVLRGEVETISYSSPWIKIDGEEIWLEDQIYLVDKDKDGTAWTILGISVNNTEIMKKKMKYDSIERANEKLLATNKRAVDLAELLVWNTNFDDFPLGDYIFTNEEYDKTLGLTKDENGYIPFADFLGTAYPDQEGASSMKLLIEKFEDAQNNLNDEYLGFMVKHQNMRTKDVVYLEHNFKVEERNEDLSIKEIGGYIINITNRVLMEAKNEKLNRKNKELQRAQRLAVQSGKIMIWYLNSDDIDHSTHFYGNKLLFSKLGLQEFGENRFMISEFNNSIYDGDEEGARLKAGYFAMDDRVETKEIESYTKLLVKHINNKTGELFYFEHNFEVEERYSDGSLKIRGGFLADVTSEIKIKKQNEYLVNNDVVTGLNNRNSFERYVSSGLLQESYSLIIADIDGLKFINDAFGHLKGDELISFVGNILSEEFGKDSNAYRIGGDEFAIISNDVDEASIIKRIGNIKSRIVQYSIEKNSSFSVSSGYEIVTDESKEFDEVFTLAENIMYRRKLGDRNSRKSKTMETVLTTLHEKTEETKEHCDRLGIYAVKTLKKMGYSRLSDLEDIQLLCKVHDIGKITISEEILSKPGKLTDGEYQKIKTHSEAGYKIVKNIVESDRIAHGVLYHHERHDGSGYPFGLPGSEIPLFAKILSLCDAYDVMIVGRKYRKAIPQEDAIADILKCSGTQFDPVITKVFIEAITDKTE